jgi:predicted neuraminidase
LERTAASQGVPEAQQRGEYHYPSIIQAPDGTLHATYSYFIPPAEAAKDDQGRLVRKAIKHAHFNEAWIRAGAR